MDINNLISYYKDCYQADTRTLTINNFFSARIENRFFVDGNDELLNGNMERYPISDAYAEKLKTNLALYKREKVLYCAAFFVIGRQEEALRKDSKICAPLFLYPAEVGANEDGHFVSVDLSKRHININFLNTLKKDGEDDLSETMASISSQIEDLSTVGQIKRVMDEKVDDVHADELLLYPMLHSESKIKRMLQPKNLDKIDGFKVIPSVAFGVFKRSTVTRGILTELQQLSKTNDYSQALEFLFDGSKKNGVSSFPEGRTPATLSLSQQQIVESVNNNICTLVIGPPGTGKSFTIASLALDFLSKGKKVLIASKTDQAVDVIYKKIEKDLGIKGVSLRAGKRGYKKELKGKLQSLLTQTRKRPDKQYEGLYEMEKVLRFLDHNINNDESLFERQVRNELRWGRYLAHYLANNTLIQRLKIRYIKWRTSLQQPHWVTTRTFLDNHEDRIHKSREYIELSFMRKVHNALYDSRTMFRRFQKSLTARRSSRKDMLFENIHLPTLLHTFPIWLVNMSDIYDVLPLAKEAFDLVIIDEATQCDIASSIPIIQRGKRVAVVGDPKQLRHASFLSRSFQYSLSKKHHLESMQDESLLDFRNTSFLDLVNDRIDDQNQVVFLNEHYRSKPDIIGFSNRQFYHGELSIMTHEPEKDQKSHMSVREIKGERNEKGYNIKEADAVIDEIKAIIKQENELDASVAKSVGVLSPFRDQVDYLGERITKEIDLLHIEKHQILCGTAYSFQGEERDTMLLSMTIDDNSHHSAIIHLNKPDVFNVSITRARSLQVIFKSFSNQFDPGENLSRYLNELASFSPPVYKSENERDRFLKEVTQSIEELQFPYWVNYSIAGLHVDLVFKANNTIYGINLIGYPGLYVDALSMNDYKILKRAGVNTFPLPYTYWKFDKEKCVEEIKQFVG